MPAAISPTLGQGQAPFEHVGIPVGTTNVHMATCDKVKVWSRLPLLIPLKTTRRMLAVRALVDVSVLMLLMPHPLSEFHLGY